jgi:hypothetical protein
MALDTKELEENLGTKFAQAEQRLQSAKTAIGISDAPQHELFGFAPRAIKIKGKMIAEAELADLEEQHGFLVEDFIRSSQIVDAHDQARANIELKKEYVRTRDSIVRAGLALDKQLSEAKIKEERRAQILDSLVEITIAGAKAYTIHKLYGKQPTVPEAPDWQRTRSSGEFPTTPLGGGTYSDYFERKKYLTK